jgi:precorrin-2 dehydrogenase/sirohydrochlorin ferrochelatase
MYPVFLNLADRLCVVIGGGEIAQRKLAGLLEGGARVRLVCLEPRPDKLHSPRLQWLTEPYRPEHLDGAVLVFAAATPEVTRRVVCDARERRLWVNAADDPGSGDFFVPALLRRGDFVIAVSTSGAAPGLAQEVRALLEPQFDDVFGRWVALLAEFRTTVLAASTDRGIRRTIFERLCRWQWLERLRHEGVETVRAAMRAEIQSSATCGLADWASAEKL